MCLSYSKSLFPVKGFVCVIVNPFLDRYGLKLDSFTFFLIYLRVLALSRSLMFALYVAGSGSWCICCPWFAASLASSSTISFDSMPWWPGT